MSHQPSAITATPAKPDRRLPRTLGLWSSVALVVGITIGSGIFRSPAGIARQAPNPFVMIGLWVAGGAITLCGASLAGRNRGRAARNRRHLRLPPRSLGPSRG